MVRWIGQDWLRGLGRQRPSGTHVIRSSNLRSPTIHEYARNSTDSYSDSDDTTSMLARDPAAEKTACLFRIVYWILFGIYFVGWCLKR